MASERDLGSQEVEEMSEAPQALSHPMELCDFDPRAVEMVAMRAYYRAQVYFNLISSVDPKTLKLTKEDDLIYTSFRETFQELDVKVLKEEDINSDGAKEKWHNFCKKFDGLVEDYYYRTLVRLDCEKNYTEANTIFANRVQFYAIEIARNKEGYNDTVFNTKGLAN